MEHILQKYCNSLNEYLLFLGGLEKQHETELFQLSNAHKVIASKEPNPLKKNNLTLMLILEMLQFKFNKFMKRIYGKANLILIKKK